MEASEARGRIQQDCCVIGVAMNMREIATMKAKSWDLWQVHEEMGVERCSALAKNMPLARILERLGTPGVYL